MNTFPKIEQYNLINPFIAEVRSDHLWISDKNGTIEHEFPLHNDWNIFSIDVDGEEIDVNVNIYNESSNWNVNLFGDYLKNGVISVNSDNSLIVPVKKI